jgi:hypothetical protein
MDEATINLHKPALSSTMSPTSIADLLPAVRGILPLTDIDALTRLTTTLCDVLEQLVGAAKISPWCRDLLWLDG